MTSFISADLGGLDIVRGRFRRAALLLVLAAGLVLLTALRDWQAGRAPRPGDLAKTWKDQVQYVPPMRIDQVDPTRPVYVSGVLKRKKPATDLDDSGLGVNFGSCVYANRFYSQRSIDPRTGDEVDVDSGREARLAFASDSETMVAPGGVEIQGATVDDDAVRAMAKWIGKVGAPLNLPPPAPEAKLTQPKMGKAAGSKLAQAHPRALREWHHYKSFKSERDQHSSSALTLQTERGALDTFRFHYSWVQPHKLYYFGGVRNGRLVPFEKIMAVQRLFHYSLPKAAARRPLEAIYWFSDQPMDISEVLNTAEAQQMAKAGDRTVPEPLSYSRLLVGVALTMLAGLCLGLSRAPTVQAGKTSSAKF